MSVTLLYEFDRGDIFPADLLGHGNGWKER
jgi:hypothetical protein